MKNNDYICNMRHTGLRDLLRPRPARDIAAVVVCLAVVCLLVFSSIWAYRNYMTSPPYVDENKYPIQGIDISRHNGKVDFKKVANSGVEFVFIKASEGKSHRDPLYAANFEKSGKAGLQRGAYHFFRFDREGADQAENFLQAIGSDIPELPLVIDVEAAGNPKNVSPQKVTERLEAMVEYMHLSGHQVMFYTNMDGYYDYIADTFPGYPLWICRFKSNPINAEWAFWQYDHHGKIDGIKGDVDLNVFSGNRREWEVFLQEGFPG